MAAKVTLALCLSLATVGADQVVGSEGPELSGASRAMGSQTTAQALRLGPFFPFDPAPKDAPRHTTWRIANGRARRAGEAKAARSTTKSLGVSSSVAVPQGAIQEMICSYSWPCAEALNVARCESGFSPTAGQSHASKGLFQINMTYHSGRFHRRGWSDADVYDAAKNTAIAFEIWSEQKWRPWSCRP